MGDLGDIFDLFSQDGGDDKKQGNKDPESKEKSNASDPKSIIINKLKQNKALLIATVGVGILVIGAVAYFTIGYIGDHGTKGILDTVLPLIK
jgi:hypothetical protein